MSTPRIEVEPATLPPRLAALVYDLFPLLGIWFAVAALSYAANGGEPVAPGSAAAWAEFLGLLLATFLYVGLSWRWGGQTLGMRAWRLRAVDTHGERLTWAAIGSRFVVSWVSLGAAGLGFVWVMIDSQGRSWHELASSSRTVRLPKSGSRQPG